MRKLFLLLLTIMPLLALEVGEKLPTLTLEGKDGARADGAPWSSDSLRGKVFVIFYVDPDKKDLNEEFVDRLKSEEFDRRYYGSVAIANLEATWMPNFAIEAALKSKQKKYPDTIYVKDRVKKGVKVWGVADDDANLIVIDANGEVLYFKSGKIPKESYEKIVDLIHSKIDRLSNR